MRQDLDALTFAKNGGIPVGMSSIFAKARAQEICADRRRESLILGNTLFSVIWPSGWVLESIPVLDVFDFGGPSWHALSQDRTDDAHHPGYRVERKLARTLL